MVNLDNAVYRVNLSIMAKQIVVGVKVNQSELDDWKAIASVSGLTVPRWLRGLANEAALNGPGIAQEASKDEQATETQAGDVAAQRPVPGDLAASSMSKAFEKDKAESVEDIPVAQSEEEAGEGASAPVASNLGRLPVKPTVNPALGRNSGGAFRESPKCQNSRCARLKMPLCEPCRVLNKGTR